MASPDNHRSVDFHRGFIVRSIATPVESDTLVASSPGVHRHDDQTHACGTSRSTGPQSNGTPVGGVRLSRGNRLETDSGADGRFGCRKTAGNQPSVHVQIGGDGRDRQLAPAAGRNARLSPESAGLSEAVCVRTVTIRFESVARTGKMGKTLPAGIWDG